MNIIKEHFNSIHEMIATIEARPNNEIMKDEKQSQTGTGSFTGTKSYNHAKELFRNGYTEILPNIKTGVAANLRRTETRPRRCIENNVVGYAPNVPNAILGLPKSMILTRTTPQKIKAVSLVVGITENCGTKTDEFIKSGIAALGVVNALELRGYRVNLKVAFYVAECEKDRAFATATLKDYREHLDLQKLCFPLAHPSMLRRFGFKWLETAQGLKADWTGGYGKNLDDLEFIKQTFLSDNEYFMNLSITKQNKYDPEKIIKYLDIEK